MVAPTVVQEAYNSRSNGAQAIAPFTTALTPGTGRYLIVAIHSPSAGATPDLANATPGLTMFPGAVADDAGRYTGFAYRKIVSGDPLSVTLALENADPVIETEVSEIHCWEVSGLNESDLLEGVSVGTAGTYTSIQPGPVSIANVNGGIIFTCAGLGSTTGGQEAITDSFVLNSAASMLDHTRTITAYKTFAGNATAVNPTISWNTANPRRANALSIALNAMAPVTVTSYRAKVWNGTAWKDHEFKRI